MIGLAVRTVATALLFPAYASLADEGPSHTGGALSSNQIGIAAGGLRRLCLLDDVSISPSGRYHVLTSSRVQPDGLVKKSEFTLILNASCVRQFGYADECMLTVRGLDGARPLAWSRDDANIFLVENNRSIVRLAVSYQDRMRAKVVDRAHIETDLGKVAEVYGPTASRTAQDQADAIVRAYSTLLPLAENSASKELHPLKLGLHGAEHSLLYFDTKSLRTFAQLESGRWTVPVTRPFLSIGDVDLLANARLAVRDLGWSAQMEADGRSRLTVVPLSRPLRSGGSGNVIGYYAPTTFSLDSPRSTARLIEKRAMALIRGYRGNMIWRAAANERGDSAYVLKSVSGTRTHASEIGGVSRIYQCSSVPAISASLAVKSIGSPAWPLGLIEARPSKAAGLVVFLQGGPATDIGEFPLHALVNQYVREGWAVLSLGYSGSVGFGPMTSMRLSDLGSEAFVKDAALLRRYIDRVYPGLPVIVHAESFGAAPALAIESAIHTRSGGFVAMVPYFLSRRPETWLEPSRIFASSLNYQARWEAAAIGLTDEVTRSTFNAQLRGSGHQRSNQRPALMIFGSADKVSQEKDIPDYLLPNARICQVSEPHMFAVNGLVSKSIVKRWIERHFGARSQNQISMDAASSDPLQDNCRIR